jgi:hypothetical protein
MDETTRTHIRRPPRAARARKAATAVSVAAMLSLGGVLAWRDHSGPAIAQTAAARSTSTASGVSAAAVRHSDDGSDSDESPSRSAVTSRQAAQPARPATSHTTTRGS